MALVLVHQSIGGISLEDDLEASCGFGVESVIEQHFWFMIGADISARQGNRIVEVDGQLLDDSRVVVIWDFPLLGQLDFLKVDGVKSSKQLLELVEGHIERHVDFLLFGVL